MGENTITHILKVSVAGTSLKESGKKFTNHFARKTTVRKLKKAEIVSLVHIVHVTGHRGINFLTTMMKPAKKSYEDSCSRPNEIMETPTLRKSKYYINTGSFRHQNNCGSTHPSIAASKENKLPPSFSGFKSQTFLHESAMMGSQEQAMMNSR